MIVHGVTQLARSDYKKRFGEGDQALIASLIQRCGGEIIKGVLHSEHQGQRFSVRFEAENGLYHISVPCRYAGRFGIRRKSRVDRFMGKLVPALPIRSRDPRFDAAFSVTTRDQRLTEDVISQQKVRRAVSELMKRPGLGHVTLAGEWVSASGNRQKLGKGATADVVLGMVADVSVVAGAVSHWAKTHERRPAPKTDSALVLVCVILGLLGIAGLTAVIAGVSFFPMLDHARFAFYAVLISLPALAAAFGLVSLALRNRTSPYRLVAGSAFFALVAVALLVSGSLMVGNGLFDQGERSVHIDPICCKYQRGKRDDNKKKKKISYYAGIVAEWAGPEPYWIRVRKPTYDAIEENRSGLLVTIAPGTLGIRWRENYGIVEDWENPSP